MRAHQRLVVDDTERRGGVPNMLEALGSRIDYQGALWVMGPA